MGCVQSYFRKAHSAGLSPSSTEDSDRLVPESPNDLKERLLTEEQNHVTDTGKEVADAITSSEKDNGDAHPPGANGSAKTGNGIGVAAAAATGTIALLGAAAAVEHAHQTREDVQKDAEELVEEVVVEAEKEVEKITSPIPESATSPEGVSVSSPPPTEIIDSKSPTSPVRENREEDVGGDKSVEDGLQKEASRPTSVVESESVKVEETAVTSPSTSQVNDLKLEEDKPIFTVDSPTITIQSPEEEAQQIISPSASQSPDSKDVEVHTRGKRSIEPEEDRADSVAQEEEVRPASIVELESTSPSRPASGRQSGSDLPEAIEEPTVVVDSDTTGTQSPAVLDKEDVDVEVGKSPSSASPVVDDTVSAETSPTPPQPEPVGDRSRPQSIAEVMQSAETATEEGESRPESKADDMPVASPEALEEETKTENLEEDENKLEQGGEGSDSVAHAVSEVVVSAATTIQATFRGHQTRQNLKKAADDTNVTETTPSAIDGGGDDTKPSEDEGKAVAGEESDSQSPLLATEEEKNVSPPETAEEEYPPPMEEEVESDLTTTNEDSDVIDIPEVLETTDDIQSITEDTNETQPQVVDAVVIESQSDSLNEAETQKDSLADDRSTTQAESEAESLGLVCDTPRSNLDVEEVSRATSNISESTVDSVTALKGSETESVDALSRLSVADNDDQQDAKSAASDLPGDDGELDKMETAATTIQASFRGFQTRKDLQRVADEALLPPPEPSQDFLFEDPVDDDLPPPPDEYDLAPPPPDDEDVADAVPEQTTPRSPETGEKVIKSVDIEQEESTLPQPPEELLNTAEDQPHSEETVITAEELAQLQRPPQCDELPEHRGEPPSEVPSRDTPAALTPEQQLALLQRPQVCDELPEHRGQLVNGLEDESPPDDEDREGGEGLAEELSELLRTTECDELPEDHGGLVNGDADEEEIKGLDGTAEELAELQRPQCDELPEHRGELAKDATNEASSAEVDDSSLSSAATKIQAGTRGYLVRKHMKDTFSTTAPSLPDSQVSIGTVQSSQDDDDDDDGVQTSGSVETEVQRHSMEDVENGGIISVVISNASGKLKEDAGVLEENVKTAVAGVGLSLDSQLDKAEKKAGVLASKSVQNPNGVDVEDQEVWQTLQTEMEDAATKIQSSFRGFSTRQRLHRENAVQMATTSSGTPATISVESGPVLPPTLRSSGEFHDMLVLPPPTADVVSQETSS